MSEELLLVPLDDIVQIADAIRTVNEINDQLILPNDFVSKILSSQSLNFNIVGGIDEPTNPKENTIWIHTDIDIPNWSIAAFEPSSPNEGDVWIHTLINGGAQINAVYKNALIFNIAKASQYIESQWTDIPMWVYSQNNWNTMQKYMILGGDTCDSVTGGWESVSQRVSSVGTAVNAPVITINPDNIYINQNQAAGGVYRTKNSIDLSGFSSIVFEGDVGGTTDNTRLYLWPSIGTYQQTSTCKYYTLTDGENVIPLELSGSCFVGFGFYGTDTITCRSLYLK